MTCSISMLKKSTGAAQALRLETGRVARQADGAVLASIGETTVLATAVAERSAKPGIDFFPLTVNYQEKTYAAGKIPGGYFKREGRPTERETLISRLIDRPIRPLFVEGFRNETQVIATVLSYDLENDTDILALVASSAALTLSGIPFMGPIGAARVGYIDGEYVLNPTIEQQKALRPRPRGRRHAGRGADGRIGSQGTLGRDHARRRHVRPPRLPAGDRGDHPPGRTLVARARATSRRRTRRRSTTRSRRSPRPRCAPAYAIPTKEARHEAVAKAKDKVLAALTGEDKPDAPHRQQDRRGLQASREGRRAQRHPRHRPPHRRPRHQDGAPDRRRSLACCRAPMVRRCSPAAKRRRWWSPRSAPARTSSTSTRSTARPRAPSCCTTTSRPSRSAKRAAWAPPAAARSATASSPGAPSTRCCRPADQFPYTIRVVSEITEFERLVLDGHGLRRFAVADGCGRAAEGALRRHRHGPDQGRRPLSPCSPTFSATRITWATWTSRWPAPRKASPRCRWTSRSPASPRRS